MASGCAVRGRQVIWAPAGDAQALPLVSRSVWTLPLRTHGWDKLSGGDSSESEAPNLRKVPVITSRRAGDQSSPRVTSHRRCRTRGGDSMLVQMCLSGTLSTCGIGPVKVESQGQKVGGYNCGRGWVTNPSWMCAEHCLCFSHIYCIRVSVDMLWI